MSESNITIPSNVHIQDPEAFNAKIKQLSADGIAKLHVAADFDRTMTGHAEADKPIMTTWAVFREYLRPEYRQERDALFDTYRRFETDMSIPFEERCEQISIWWQKHSALLMNEHVDKALLQKMIADGHFRLRDQTADVMHFCSEHNIPFLIYSAGIGDLTQILLSSKGLLTPNVNIISNFFTYDKDEVAGGNSVENGNGNVAENADKNAKVTGFEKDIVHTLNKDHSLIVGTAFESTITDRPNVILLSDQISDKDIIKDAPVKTVLTIGFLNGNEQNRESFAKEFDVLILEDTGMEFVESILKAI